MEFQHCIRWKPHVARGIQGAGPTAPQRVPEKNKVVFFALVGTQFVGDLRSHLVEGPSILSDRNDGLNLSSSVDNVSYTGGMLFREFFVC